jgi:hypothetical protein
MTSSAQFLVSNDQVKHHEPATLGWWQVSGPHETVAVRLQDPGRSFPQRWRIGKLQSLRREVLKDPLDDIPVAA